jgi:hypothetical protein
MGEAKRRRMAAAASSASADTEHMPIVEPENWCVYPPGYFAMVVSFGEATLRGGIGYRDVPTILRPNAEERKVFRDGLVQAIKTNQHLNVRFGTSLLTVAIGIALTSPIGELIEQLARDGAISSLTYVITPLATADDYNWRLFINGAPTETVH